MQIRAATRAYLDDLAPLLDAFRVAHRRVSDPPRARRFVDARLARGDVALVALRHGQALGFALLGKVASSLDAGAAWRLDALYVLPAARRGGVGSALLAAAIARARDDGGHRLELAAAARDLDAQRFLERSGGLRDCAQVHYHYDI